MSVTLVTGASSTNSFNWSNINWSKVKARVYRLQMRIAKGTKETNILA